MDNSIKEAVECACNAVKIGGAGVVRLYYRDYTFKYLLAEANGFTNTSREIHENCKKIGWDPCELSKEWNDICTKEHPWADFDSTWGQPDEFTGQLESEEARNCTTLIVDVYVGKFNGNTRSITTDCNYFGNPWEQPNTCEPIENQQ